ncbi:MULTISPECIES: hypothetical protein [unclassified Streptomyces]|uniref:hypothetical protein n=1 Tax=unclassified Streptomyces TaxID=2593676 RepID=UPI0040411B75
MRVSAIEPGIVGTERQDHLTAPGARTWIDGSKDTIDWLMPDGIAQTVGFIASLPLRVHLPRVFICRRPGSADSNHAITPRSKPKK